MKKFSMLLSFALVATGVAFAATQEKAPAPAKSTATHAAKSSALKTHEVAGEFVSYDAAKKTLTMKTDTGESTAPVKGKALTEVKAFKAGDKVLVTCRDKADGTHEAAIAIKKAPAETMK